MIYFKELDEKILPKIRRKIKNYRKYNKIFTFNLFFTILFFVANFYILFKNYTQIMFIREGTIILSIFILFIYILSISKLNKNKLTLKEIFLLNLDNLRKEVHKKDSSKFIELLRRKISILQTNYNFNKPNINGFEIEKEIHDFFERIILNLKHYSKKDHLTNTDKNEIHLFLEIILERILKENFQPEGIKRYTLDKKFDFIQLKTRTRSLLKSNWARIIFLIFLPFPLLVLLKIIGWIEGIEFLHYVGCETIILMIYFGIIKNKNL